MFEFNGFFGESRFRIWCQKVLPTIYDDSLSYYELLCKVLKVLEEYGNGSSELANEVVNLHEDVEGLRTEVSNAVSALKLGVVEVQGYAQRAERSAQVAEDAIANIEQYKGLEKVAELVLNYDDNWYEWQYCYFYESGYGGDPITSLFDVLKTAKLARTIYPHPYGCVTETMSSFSFTDQSGYDGTPLEDISPITDIQLVRGRLYGDDIVTRLVVSRDYYMTWISPYHQSPGYGHTIEFYK